MTSICHRDHGPYLLLPPPTPTASAYACANLVLLWNVLGLGWDDMELGNEGVHHYRGAVGWAVGWWKAQAFKHGGSVDLVA